MTLTDNATGKTIQMVEVKGCPLDTDLTEKVSVGIIYRDGFDSIHSTLIELAVIMGYAYPQDIHDAMKALGVAKVKACRLTYFSK